MDHGYVHLYTGDGKGKTTAAMGIVMRSLAAGYRVYVGQFMKHGYTGEYELLKRLITADETMTGQLVFEQYGTGYELAQDNKDSDAFAAQEGFQRAYQVLLSEDFDVVVLDEINVATYLGYIETSALVNLIDNKPESCELILTGRYASDSVMKVADLVTEMKPLKHYFDKGVQARKGIEF